MVYFKARIYDFLKMAISAHPLQEKT